MQDFRSLKVWQKGHELTIAVYKATAKFPKQELYGITSQMRRASASIPSNVAEGCGRAGKPELGRFLQISMGSASELEYHLLLSRDLELLSDSEYRRLDALTIELKRMLSSFIVGLRG
ncbi:MAG: diversity-generating retroelement protein bAvd family protein [Acidobacteria bacterium]|nr:MAG: diversity-generating retroelement protein bAvd family protein [Acidobacteriota bacterium]